MRRMIITAVAAISLAAPSAALAHSGERHHHHRGRHHNHAHVLAFHAQAPASAPTTPASQSAGSIVSFADGTLTIKLTDGSTVAGKVGNRTEIECPAMTAGAADFGSGRDRGDDNDRFDDRGQDGSGGPGPSNEDEHRGDCPGHDDNAQNDDEHCTTAALVPGASVKEAFLGVSSAGSEWLKVELG
ncbi:MAG TPA: hypothetical protein VGH21_05915 [Solirubrobacteraceae bacterium]